ncbi:electron transport complex subunit RsxC [Vibrio albus]|uniref:Ion-translocating oxidoreductase complex subunit C n=1 Tax=Vibrio albus TaxID=2200953 RepID=A0A2U3BBV5_9VIBR|nr:electron transport complex subunit RsxC [Vibrio albus]PWI34270.1 electron transport complex subunit RsxC [Vibrio albus]
MLSLIEKIRHGYIWDFHGGTHPAENKQQSVQLPVTEATMPDELVLPLKQHIGKPGELTVQVGDRVLKGQALTSYINTFMLPVHAPTSGVITSIEPKMMAHPSGLSEMSIILRPDGEDKWIDKTTYPEFRSESPEELIEVIRNAGISGMGGAGFPTAKKIHSGLGKTDILIINAAECEPYITADDMLMREKAPEIIQGIEILQHILRPKLVIIGIEDNKPEAITALEQAAINHDLVIRVVPTKYPSGGEKQLIKILTNQEVPKGGIPADINTLVQNVTSVYAIKRAIIDGEPLTERIVTLTGNAFRYPRNVLVKLGTPVQALLDEFGYQAEKKHPRLIMGGPMMGFTLPSAQVPITKTANCILAPGAKEIPPPSPELACIRCSQCADACPVTLLPQQLQWYAKDQDYDKCEELNLFDCMECGVCAYVCPSEIPLVHYYRKAKAEIREKREEARAAERAKQRFEEKQARMERDKAEREQRSKRAAEERRKEMQQSQDGDAIAAAIARVKAKQASPAAEAGPKPAVAAAIARAKAKQAEAAKANSDIPDNSEMAKLREERKRQAQQRKAEKEAAKTSSDSSASVAEGKEDKKAAVAAAIARAKAKKAQQAEAETSEPQPAPDTEKVDTDAPVDPKKAVVAAAIARAKAKKAKQAEAETSEPQPAPDTEKVDTDAPVDPKKAAVAAAIARAKAKKAKQAEAETSEPQPAPDTEKVDTDTPVDPKKAAVAAAIARAKAKKAAQNKQPDTKEKE